MRVGQVRRPEWYRDLRNIVALCYEEEDVFPHDVTARFQYTPETGTCALLTSAQIVVLRHTQPTTAGRIKAWLHDGTDKFLLVESIDSAPGGEKGYAIGQNHVIFEGSSLTAYTSDSSVTGDVDYFIAVGIVAYNRP